MVPSMKKNFSLTSEKHRPDRQVELVKAEVNKYVARERRKKLPEGVDFWDFDCKCGATAETAATLHIEEIGKKIAAVAAEKSESVYIEILAKPGVRKKKV